MLIRWSTIFNPQSAQKQKSDSMCKQQNGSQKMFGKKSLKRFVFTYCELRNMSDFLMSISFISTLASQLTENTVILFADYFFNFLIFTPHFDVAVQNKTRITKAGELLVTSELSRSQQRNLSDCIQKISAIIAEASEKPHEPTAEDIALRAARYCLEWRYLVVDLL